MIRFVDLTEPYFCDTELEGVKIFAFISTVTDEFVSNDCGGHTFHDLEDVEHAKFGDIDRLKHLIPTDYLKDVKRV